MSMKKDAFGNIGGVVSLDSDAWAEKVRNAPHPDGRASPPTGGSPGVTWRRSLSGCEEILDEDYLRYRIASTGYRGPASR